MMMSNCPYCGEPLKGDVLTPEMSLRQQRIYTAVLHAGPDGIPTKDLLLQMYNSKQAPTPGGGIVLRVQINKINELLHPVGQRIIGRQLKGYRLVRKGLPSIKWSSDTSPNKIMKNKIIEELPMKEVKKGDVPWEE
jgi:hypothetical protein